MSTSTLHSTDSSIDPLSQFQSLSKSVSRASRRARVKVKNSIMSPREEIYKSMLREIKSGDIPQMNSLVHKASGILRLSHYNELNKGRKVNVSWDINGRRIVTYEDKTGNEKSMLQRQTVSNQNSKQNLVSILNEPIFGLDPQNLKTLSEFYDTSAKSNNTYEAAIGDLPSKRVSKVWEEYIDTGDVSKLFESKEGILATESFTPSPFSSSTVSRQPSSINSLGISIKSPPPPNSEISRPPWKTFYRLPSSTFVPPTVGSKTKNSVSVSVPSMVSNQVKKHPKKDLQTPPERKTHSSTRLAEKEKKPKHDKDQEESEKIQVICVVNGSVVTFKNFGFENFTNWFGDESVLENNQKRCQPKIHLELDLCDVNNRDIRIRLFDGSKLEVEAKRRVPGSSKPIRVKEVFTIPAEYRAEDLLMCRTKSGKLVIEEITQEPVSVKTDSSKRKSPKSKAKWIISRK